jgi:hypothetical protein
VRIARAAPGYFAGKFAAGFRANAFRDRVVLGLAPIRPFALANIDVWVGKIPL